MERSGSTIIFWVNENKLYKKVFNIKRGNRNGYYDFTDVDTRLKNHIYIF